MSNTKQGGTTGTGTAQTPKVTKLLDIKNLKVSPGQAKKKWNQEQDGPGLIKGGVQKVAKLLSAPGKEEWEKEKAAAKQRIDRLRGGAIYVADIDLDKCQTLLDGMIQDTEKETPPQYGRGITKIRGLTDDLAERAGKSNEKAGKGKTKDTMALYQEVSQLLYRGRGVVRDDIMSGWDKRMQTFGTAALKEALAEDDGGKKKAKTEGPSTRDALAALRDELLGTGGSEDKWGVPIWTNKLEQAHAQLDKLRQRMELGETAPKPVQQAADEIGELISQRQLAKALQRLQQVEQDDSLGGALPKLPDAGKVKQKLAEVLEAWKSLTSLDQTGQTVKPGEVAKYQQGPLSIQIDQVRMYCKVAGGGSDPQTLPDEAATTEFFQQLVSLEKAIATAAQELKQKGQGKQEAEKEPEPGTWEKVREDFAAQTKSLQAALKQIEAFPTLMLQWNLQESVPQAIAKCDELIEHGEAGSEDTATAEKQLQELATMEQGIKDIIAQAKGNTGDKRKQLHEQLEKLGQILSAAKSKPLPKKYKEVLESWAGTLEMDQESLNTLVDTVAEPELAGIEDEIKKFGADATKFAQMCVSVSKQGGDPDPKEFTTNTKKAEEIAKQLAKMFGKDDYKTSRAPDSAEFTKRLDNIKGRINSTEPSKLAGELKAFEEEVTQYETAENQKIADAKQLLEERYQWLAVVYDQAKALKKQQETATKTGASTTGPDNKLALLDKIKRSVHAFETGLLQSLSVTAASNEQAEAIRTDILALQQNKWPADDELAKHGDEAKAVAAARSALDLFLKGELASISKFDPRNELAGKLRAAAKAGIEELDKSREADKAQTLLKELRSRLGQPQPSNVSKRGDLTKMLNQLNAEWRREAKQFDDAARRLIGAVEKFEDGEAQDVKDAIAALIKRLEPLQGVFEQNAFTRAFDDLAAASGEKAVARSREPIMASVRNLRSMIQSTPAFRLLGDVPFEPKPDLRPLASVLNMIEKNVIHRH